MNSIHNDSCPVHQALLNNSLKKLKLLFEEGGGSLVTCRNASNETPLLTSIIKNRNDNIILYLIDAGSDVNVRDNLNRTSLHAAVEYRSNIKVIEALLKKGVNVNAQDIFGHTPLHHSILYGTEILNILLYYDADVTIESSNCFTVLEKALSWYNFDAVQVLADYYCDEDLSRIFTQYVIQNHCQLMLQNPDLFILVWNALDKQSFLIAFPEFILIYLNCCIFETEQWLKCLLVVLESDIAYELVQYNHNNRRGFAFRALFCSLYDRKINLDDQLTLIYLFLSLGAEVCSNDISDVIDIYGCGVELETLIYGTTCDEVDAGTNPLCPFILLKNEHLLQSYLLELFQKQIVSMCCIGTRALQNSLINAMGYFSLSSSTKLLLIDKCADAHLNVDSIRIRLCSIPEIPTLVELSRNAARNYLIKFYNVKRPYTLFDVVKKISLPTIITDIILFKCGLY